MSNKKKTGAVTGIAAIFTATLLAFFGTGGETVLEVDYSLTKNETVCELSVYPPDEAEADIIELYVGESLVTKALLPSGKLKSIPFVFSDLNNLELRLYKYGNVIGIGKFNEDKLYVAFKDSAVKNAEEAEEKEDAEK